MLVVMCKISPVLWEEPNVSRSDLLTRGPADNGTANLFKNTCRRSI